MRMREGAVLGWAVLAVLAAQGTSAPPAPQISFETYSLPNGLRVILSPDRTVPVAAVSSIFDVGSRQERKGRSGFAHLFEHLMFGGSRNAPKGVYDRLLESYGGDNNASTHKDFTLYYEIVPSNALPIPLWLDADRLSSLAITQEALENQISVVKEEKRMRVDNEPYGPLLYEEVAKRSYRNWQNSHSVIGSFADLEAGSLQDVKDFFDTYYAPSNGILALVGDFDPAQAKEWLESYFGWIPNRAAPGPLDTSEPDVASQTKVELTDAHANLPALVLAWRKMPERRTAPDFYALTLLGNLLFQGKGSRLYRSLVKEKQVAVQAEGGLGFPESDFWEFKAPGLFGCFVIYKEGRTAQEVRELIEQGIGEVAKNGVPDKELARVKTKFRSDWIRSQQTVLGRAKMLLRAALLDGDPGAANGELERYMAVKSSEVQSAAQKYLAPEQLMILDVKTIPKKP